MEFLYPGFLYALFALAIPVIIHLFNFRRFKKIPFTNVRFLREIKQQTQSQNKLRHLLILLMRMLAITLLVLAFAQPYIPNEEDSGSAARRNVSIFVDNSFSMEGESTAGTMIEVAKNRAIDIAMAHDASDRFQLLSQDFEGKHQRLVNRDVFVEWVQELDLSPQSHDLSEIYTRQRDLLSQHADEGESNIFIVSDFQKSRFDLEQLPSDTGVTMSLVLLERYGQTNLYIDSLWFATPVRKLNDNERLSVRVVNTGSNAVENVPVRLDVNGAQRAIASVNVEANSKAIASLEYVHESGGLQKASVSIQDSPVSYDDHWYFSYDVFDEIAILAVRQNENAPDPLRNVFAGDSVYQYSAVNARSVDYASLSSQQLVVLSGLDEVPSGLAAELRTFVENGGSLWLIPSSEADLESYNSMLSAFAVPTFAAARTGEAKVITLNTEHPLYSGVFESMPRNLDLPKVQRHYPSAVSTGQGGDALMLLAGGNPFLASYRPGRGQLYILTASLLPDESNFARHALFVATALRIAELSQSTTLRWLTIESDAYFNVPSATRFSQSSLHLINREENIDVIPLFQQRDGQYMVSPGPEIDKAGIYALVHEGENISAVGINYSRAESELSSYSSTELESAIAEREAGRIKLYDGSSDSLGKQVAMASRGTPLWKICLILALAFLLAETLLIRFWKTRTA